MTLQGDYCEACRTERLPLSLYRVAGRAQFTLCDECSFLHEGEVVEETGPGEEAKRRIWETIRKRAGYAS